jgi:PAS domain S-box-containing protein
VNHAWEKIIGIKSEQAVGRFLSDILPAEVAHRFDRINEEILRTGIAVETEESIDCPTGLHYFHVVKFPLQDASGHNSAVGAIFVDITDRRLTEQQLKTSEAELRARTEQLGDMNTALRVLLRQREDDKREIEERVVCNVRELVLPYVHKLKGMHLNETLMNYLEIVEMHLNDIITPFFRQIVSDHPHLTPRELQVLTFVREGKTNKEIADLMNVSVNAVEIHRFSVRKKLGIQNRRINLRSYLLSMRSPTT